MIKISLLVMALLIAVAVANAKDEGLTSEQLKALDNAPNDCLEGEIPNGTMIDDSFHKSSVQRPDPIIAMGGTLLKGAPISLRRVIDGPANLRDKPSGRVITSFPHKFTVLLEGQKGDWYYLRGYKDRPCDAGWTYKSNIFK